MQKLKFNMDFNLRKKIETEQKLEKIEYDPTIYTEDEKNKLLIGYDLVVNDNWGLLKEGDHVRYELTDGKFRRGGFIHNKVNIKGKPSLFIETARSPNSPGYVKFPVVLENVGKIWKKRTAESIAAEVTETSIAMTDENLARLEARMNKFESDLHKVVLALTKLSEKVSVTLVRGSKPSGTYPTQQ